MKRVRAWLWGSALPALTILAWAAVLLVAALIIAALWWWVVIIVMLALCVALEVSKDRITVRFRIDE